MRSVGKATSSDPRRFAVTNTGDETAWLADRKLELFESDEFPAIKYEGAYALEPGDSLEWVADAGGELYADGQVDVETIDAGVRDHDHGPADEEGDDR